MKGRLQLVLVCSVRTAAPGAVTSRAGTLTLGHGTGAALMAQVIFNFACTERSKSGELKSPRATLGSKGRTYKNFASDVNSWGKVRVNGGDKAGHCHSPLPLLAPERQTKLCSDPGPQRGLLH